MKPSFEQMVKDYINLVYYFALRSIKKEEVDDVVGNTFLKAFKAYNDFQFSSKNQLKCWLLTICRNVINDSYRAKTPIALDNEIVENIEGESSIEKFMETTIKNDEVNEALNKLKSLELIDQEIIKLRVYEEMEFKEIAGIFNVKEATIKMKFYRAVKSLRETYENKRTS